ncbi:MAG: glycosyltransferase family 9 protein [Alphaproteobacteria bacterium]|nr:glycosyltransferase family 9 protein [Alphaproteobacteria bacterium]
MSKSILIIKLGALGDMVQATPAFAALRHHHADDKITLLTTQPFHDLAQKLGYFDTIWIDDRAKLYQLKKLLSIPLALRRNNFHRVYDLQGVERTRLYSRLMKSSVDWIGPVFEDNHPQDRFRHQLERVGISFDPSLNLRFIADHNKNFNLPKPYALLIPGASNAHNGCKRWPQENYAALATHLLNQEIQPVVIGGPGESFPQIKDSIDLTGCTTFYQVIALAEGALFAIGNDTGPMLLAASGGCPTVTFFSDRNPPTLGGAQGPKNQSLFSPDLEDLSVQTVIDFLCPLTTNTPAPRSLSDEGLQTHPCL